MPERPGPDGHGPDWPDGGHVWLPYTQMKIAPPPLAVERTDGVRLYLADGRVLIDGIASWWTAVHGYNHPRLVAAIAGQAARMPHVMLGGLVHRPVADLARRLAALLPGPLNRVFFSDSGSVAVEVAMKMAVQYWRNRGHAKRRRFVSFAGNYHGDTFAAMSVCDPEEGMHRLFAGVMPRQFIAPLPETDAARAALDRLLETRREEIAAVVVEPLIQGAIGMRMHGAGTLRAIGEAARAHGLPVIADEIFTGFGRTGTMFAFEQAGLAPDIVTLSKALTGGTLPLAATVASEEIFSAFLSDDADAALMHGPTYMGNATACAAALASLDLFAEEPRLAQVRAIERRLEAALRPLAALPNVSAVRVRGAVGAVELAANPRPERLRRRFLDARVWLRPIGNVVYTTPPYVIDEADLARVTGAVADAVAAEAVAAEAGEDAESGRA